MYSKVFVKRIGAAALSLTMAASLLPMALAADPIVDETYYGTLDYYGILTEGSVVKSYRLNGNTDLADIGSYTQVNNLTDRTEPVIEGDRVTFHLTDDSLKNFYFEGKTDKPFQEMPFLISISYQMNGVPVDAEDMAGQTGLAEITLNVRPNPLASAYQRNNFALEAAAVLKDSDLLSFEAPGGQLQKVGDMVTALYLVLPGETRSFTLRIGAENFSFPGFTFMIQPATLAQLDQIKELKEAKDELEDAARDLSDSLDTILTSLEGMDTDLRQTSAGLDRLDLARSILSSGKARVYDQADQTLASLTDLTESLKPVAEHIQTGKEALAESARQLVVLTENVDGLRPELQDLRTDLVDLQGDMNALNETLDLLKDDGLNARKELRALSGDLSTAEDDLDLFKGDVRRISQDLSNLRRDLDSMDGDLGTLQSDLDRVSARTGSVENALKHLKLNELSLPPVNAITINGTKYSTADVRSAHVQADGLYQLCTSLPVGAFDDSGSRLLLTKQERFAQYLQDNAVLISRALVVSQGGDAIREGVAQALAANDPPITPETVGEEMYEALFQAAFEAQVEEQAAVYEEQLSDPVQAHLLSFLHYQWNDGVNVERQLDALDQFNRYIQDGSDRINSYITALNGVTSGTSDLLAALDTLTKHISDSALTDARDLLDDSQTILSNTQTALDHTDAALDTAKNAAEDARALLDTGETLIGHLISYDTQALNDHANNLFNTTGETLDQLDAILTQTTLLSQTITDYEPDAQAALDDASRQVSGAVALLEDLNTFSKSLEDLMKAADPDLDQGAAATLRGLSSTLRQMADGLETTSSIRRAKDAITRLVEDKWEEYTGGENNLLNMDSQAEMVSLTSPENPAPNTITLVLRSQEIKTEETEETRSDGDGGQEQETPGFWGRVGRMFHDFAAIFTGDS